MTQPVSSGSNGDSGKNRPVYGTQFSAFGSDHPSVADSGSGPADEMFSSGRKTDSSQGSFATRMARPVHQLLAETPPDLPDQSAFREVTTTRRAEISQLNLLIQMAADQKRKAESDNVSITIIQKPVQPDALPRSGGEKERADEFRTVGSHGIDALPRSGGEKERGVGKSTWNLRIHRRDVTGAMPEIDKRSSDSPVAATSLQAAFSDEENAPEYEVLGELAAGNMGVVYHARQLSLNRELAIKTLKPGSSHADHDQAMFVSEAVVTANLVHPNIVPIHDLGRTDDGRLFYSMKKVIGVPWHHVIRQNAMEDNLEIFMKLCDAVAYAHSRGVVNRDLKPENVIVGDYGEVVVLDWGLAITTDRFEKQKSILVEFRGGCGTPVYMAPELLDEDVQGVGPHTDIYLLGAILFEVIEGFPPHLLRRYWNLDRPADQLNGVISAVLDNEIEEDVAHPGELMQIARKAMSTSPSQRYQSVEAFQDAIREYRITGRGEELLNSVDPRTVKDYTSYQSAVALYGEALRKWPNNRRAINGDRAARMAYAQLAQRMGDVDLGLQVLAGQSDESFRPLVSKLKKTRLIRKIVRATWGVTTVAAVSLMIVSYLLMLGAENSKNDALVAEKAAVAAKNETDAALKENIRVNGEKIKSQEAAKAAKGEAAAAKKIAEAEAQRATLETKKASEATAKANEAAIVAAMETERAKAAAELAIDEMAKATQAQKAAEVAKNKADDATAMLATVKADADKAREGKYQSELDGFYARIKAAQDLGHYNDVIHLAEEACKKADENPLIKKKESLLRDQIRDAKENGGNAKIPLEGKPDAVSISSDGSTVVLVHSFGREKHVSVLRNESGLHGSHPTPIKIPANLKNDVKVTVSDDGTCFCLFGKSERQLWQLQDDGYQSLTITEEPAGENMPVFGWAIFSSNGQHLYLIGSDKKATVDICAIGSGTARLLIRQPLAKASQSDYRIRDVVLVPSGGRSSLIAEFESQPCRQYWIDWKDPSSPVFDKLANEAPQRGPLMVSSSGTLNKANRLCISPDAQQLAFVFSDTVVILPAIMEPDSSKFSFATSQELAGKDATLAVFRSTDRVTDLRFSRDGSRIATGHGKRYIQLWDRKSGNFVPCSDSADLFTHRPTKLAVDSLFATCLRGHSDDIKTFEFADGNSDRLISAGLDQSVRTWQISSYGNLVNRMESICRAFEPDVASKSPTADTRHSVPVRGTVSDRQSRSQLADSGKMRIGAYFLTGAATQPPQNSTSSDGWSEFRFGRNVYSSRFSPDGSRVLIGADDLAAHVVDSRTGKQLQGPQVGRRDLFFDPERNFFSEGHLSQISSVQFLPPNGELLLSADYFGSISVWDAQGDNNGVGFERARLLSEYSFSEFAVSSDGSLVLAGGAVTSNPAASLRDADLNHVGMLWKTADILSSANPAPTLVLDKQHADSAITAVGISDASTRLVTAGRRGKIVVWDAKDGSVIATAPESHNRDQVVGIFFESESQLVSAGYDGKIFRWSIEGDKLVASEIKRGEQQKSPEFIIRLRPAPDRQRFATSEVVVVDDGAGTKSSQLNILIWSEDQARPLLSKGITIPNIDKETAFRHDVSWSSDGNELMLIQDGTVSVFDTTNWKLTRKLRLNSPGARPVRGAFAPSPDKSSSQIATFDGRFTHLWDLAKNKHLAEFRSHAAYNVTASYSSDQNFVATASETLRVFGADEHSANLGRTIFRLNVRDHHTAPLSDVAFSPVIGDLRLVTVDSLGTVEIWNWQSEAETPLAQLAECPPASVELPVWMVDKELTCGNAAVWCAEGKSLAVLQSGVLSLLSVNENETVLKPFPLPDGLECRFNQLDFSVKNNFVAAGGVAWNASASELISFSAVWDMNGETPTLLATLPEEHSIDQFTREPQRADINQFRRTGVTAIAFDDNRNRIITGGADGRLIIWGLTGLSENSVPSLGVINDMKKKGFTTNAHEFSVSSIDVAIDGRTATADQSGLVILWESAEQ